MNKRERVLAALNNQEVDYVPGCFWRHFPAEKSHGQIFVDEQIKFFTDTDVDFMKISCDGYFGWPADALKNLDSAKDLYQMKHLGKAHPFIREQVERAKSITAVLHEECCVFYTMFCPLSYLRLQIGWDKMMECMKEDPDAVMFAVNIIGEDVNHLVQGLLAEAGCDGIFYSVQSAEVNRFTYEEYRSWVTPSDKLVLNYANSLSSLNIIHCCGWDADDAGTVNQMEVWQDYESAAVNWASYVDHLDVSAAKEFFGDRCVLGGFDNRKRGVLYHGNREEIQAETRRLIGEVKKRGFILGADCSLPDDIDPEHIKWVLEESRK